MDTKFRIGDEVVIIHHPDKKMIGKRVVVEDVKHAKFLENIGYVDHAVYRVSFDKKNLGWAPEKDLSINYVKKGTN